MSNDAVVKTRVGFVKEITKATDTKAIKTSFHELLASLLGKEDKKLEHIQELAKNWLGGDTEASKAFNDEIEAYCEQFPVEVGIQLRSSLNALDKDASLSLRGNLIKEHGISKITDKLFLDLALNAYFRALRCSAIYHTLIQNKDGEIVGINSSTLGAININGNDKIIILYRPLNKKLFNNFAAKSGKIFLDNVVAIINGRIAFGAQAEACMNSENLILGNYHLKSDLFEKYFDSTTIELDQNDKIQKFEKLDCDWVKDLFLIKKFKLIEPKAASNSWDDLTLEYFKQNLHLAAKLYPINW